MAPADTSRPSARTANPPDGRGASSLGTRNTRRTRARSGPSAAPTDNARSRAPRRELREGGRIVDWLAAGLDRDVVAAAVLALLADTRRDPPHRRVKEQQRLGNGLSDVDRVIPPADSGASSCAISASICAAPGRSEP